VAFNISRERQEATGFQAQLLLIKRNKRLAVEPDQPHVRGEPNETLLILCNCPYRILWQAVVAGKVPDAVFCLLSRRLRGDLQCENL